MGILSRIQSNNTATSDTASVPPAYGAEGHHHGEPAPPSFTDFPSSYKIGTHLTKPLVSVSDLQAHLRLLGAFNVLREQVERLESSVVVSDPKARWGIFIALAVGRFATYLEAYKPSAGSEVILPPIDVALCWHAYALNPRWYQEDSQRNLPVLAMLGGFPLAAYAELLDGETLETRPTPAQISTWKSHTGLPWDPVTSFAAVVATGTVVLDPSSGTEVPVPYVTAEGTGYAQLGFETITHAGFKITHEVLGIARFVQDIITLTNPDTELTTLAGTLFAPNEPRNHAASLKRTAFLQKAIRGTKALHGPDPVALGDRLKWSQDGTRAAVSGQVFTNPRALNNVLGAYTRGEPFSLDLIGAVLRQGSFVKKMVDLGWTLPRRFSPGLSGDQGEEVLHRCIARLHAFYDLCTSNSSLFFVPTLDIDLAWHSHQLNAFQYKQDCWKYMYFFLNHDDKVAEDALSTSFDVTARAWKARFNVPYSTCGCPSPDDSTGTKLFSKLSLGTKKPLAPSPLTPSDPNSTSSDATHASEHNSIYLSSSPLSASARTKREKERKARLERDEKLVAKGKLPRSVLDRQRDHETAFLYPVPLYAYGVYGYPVGAGGCAAVSGGFTSGAACASGGAACGGGSGGAACAGGASAACSGGGGGGGCGGGGCGGGGGGN